MTSLWTAYYIMQVSLNVDNIGCYYVQLPVIFIGETSIASLCTLEVFPRHVMVMPRSD
jgi:hypothetical protein